MKKSAEEKILLVLRRLEVSITLWFRLRSGLLPDEYSKQTYRGREKER